jgi:P4 family phage/plasmid primase-like protien
MTTISKLNKLLAKYKCESVSFTHVSICHPKEKYSIPRSDLENFWDLYCNFVVENKDTNNYLFLAEKPKEYLPILADVDIKIEEKEPPPSKKEVGNESGKREPPKKLYTKKQLQSIVEIYQSVIRNIVNDCKDEHLTCFVLEKKPRRIEDGTKSYIKNGFHLHFPYTFLNSKDQELHLIPRVKDIVKEQNTFSNLGIADSSKLIDDGYLKNTPWLMYGSRKENNRYIYSLSFIVGASGEEISIKKALSHYVVFDNNETELDIKDNLEFYLPRILSIIPFNRVISELKQDLESPLRNAIKKISPTSGAKKVYKDMSLTETLGRAREIVALISKDRADDRNDWIRVGWALFNIGEGSYEALQIWDEFSSQSEKYDANNVTYEWNKMTRKNMTLGSLVFYAKTDNPEEYSKLTHKYASVHLQNSLNGSHNDIAKAMYEKYGSEFVCASISQKLWYQYENHHWRKVEEGITLRLKMSNDLMFDYAEMLKTCSDNYVVANDENKTALGNRMKLIVKIMNNLKSSPFKNNVMKECTEVFYNEMFSRYVDKNKYLIGFKNGVYDLQKNEFRNGVPEDYLSMQMPIDYIELSDTDPKVIMVNDFFEKIFPDTSIREYFFNNYCDIFVGGNQRKKVLFWTGEGDNGKSKVEELFEKMLGPYAVKLPTSLIVGKKTQSSAATPELVRAGNGVRFCVLQEPDKRDSINAGMFKELSGNDTMYARALFVGGCEIEPMFKLAIVCNVLPALPYDDRASWNRARVLPFESTFCDDPPETWEEQLREKRFLKDPDLSDKIPEMVQAFAWILLRHRRKGITNYSEPEKVKAATNSYRKKNDLYRQYLDECIGEKKSGVLSLTELYISFREWFKESMPGRSCPIKEDVKEYFIKLWGDAESGMKWKGYYLRSLNDSAKKVEESEEKDEKESEEKVEEEEEEVVVKKKTPPKKKVAPNKKKKVEEEEESSESEEE